MQTNRQNNTLIKISIALMIILLFVCLILSNLAAKNIAFAYPTPDIKNIIEKHVDWDAINAASAKSKSNKLDISIVQTKTDKYGTPVGETTQNNFYFLIPGHKYVQDPAVHVSAGSSPCEIFVFIEDPVVEVEGPTTIDDQIQRNGWVPLQEKKGLYKYNKIIEESSTDERIIDVASFFTITPNTTRAELEKYNEDHFTFTAYAYGTGGPVDTESIDSLTAQTSDSNIFDTLFVCFAGITAMLVLILLLKRHSANNK